jgi:hypothetical protein
MKKVMLMLKTTGLMVSILLAAAACADADSASEEQSSTDATSGVGGAGGATISTGVAQGGAGAGFDPVGSGGSMSCLESSAEATVSPLDIVVLLDRSGSMAGSLWNGSVSALSSFFQNPGGADISAGISYFPPPGSALECQPSSYNPLHVPIVDLATSAATLDSDMMMQTPAGNATPTWAGLYGTLQYANDHQDLNPDHVVIVVLASDGDPTSCNIDINDISALAATAYAYNGVRTFVVAIQGATVSNLDMIAAAGGTMQAYDVTTDVTLFKQKMDEIRKQVLSCEFVIPDPRGGEEFDPGEVNVNYTPGGSNTPESIPQAADANDCGDDPGWYYDNPSAPKKILFCPATCDLIQMDDRAKVEFVFGCPTVVN